MLSGSALLVAQGPCRYEYAFVPDRDLAFKTDPHTRLSPNDRAAASQRIEELWQTGAASGGDPLLQRAKAWVENEEAQVQELAELVQRLEEAERAGDLESAARWREELTDLLYDLEGAVTMGSIPIAASESKRFTGVSR